MDERLDALVRPGARLGPYEVVALLGAGGMGQVYRARDPRLDRDVAIKVLTESFSGDPDRLRRFEQEARAVSRLNHPNVLALYDVGSQEGAPYVVSELLEGATLRERLADGPLPTRRAVDHALQIAHGLAAAHDKGIVHRDLKPENVFVTKDGRVKILDFGLARQIPPDAGTHDTNSPTMPRHTEPGAVLGTVGYMSPEQVRGLPADGRSDIFALGTVLYEMLSGRRAFQGPTAAETMAAILRDEPPEMVGAHPQLPAGLDRVVRHCLEKSPDERFQSARDLVFDLQALAEASTARVAAVTPRGRILRRVPLPLAGALVTVALAFGFAAGRARDVAREAAPSFRRLTFRRGTIRSARFAPDGRTVVYGAAWDGAPTRLFLTRIESPESTALSLPDADILSISSLGEMALSLGHTFERTWIASGTLARAPLLGGAPRPVQEHVREADWTADGAALAVVRRVGGKERIEFPAGTALYETEGYVSHLRFSRTGDRVAFMDHPVWGDDRGAVAVVDRAGRKTALAGGWSGLRGLAWSPAGDEVWFTGDKRGEGHALYAVDLSGRQRTLLRVPGSVILLDVSREGRILLAREEQMRPILVQAPGSTRERDISFADYSGVRDISDDGTVVLISDFGEGSGEDYSVYIRRTDGSPGLRLGEGEAGALSPDGRQAAAIVYGPPSRVLLLPTGVGETKALATDPVAPALVRWLPDGRRLVLAGQEPGRGPRLYLLDVEGGRPRPISPEGVRPPRPEMWLPVSPDGTLVLATRTDGALALFPTGGGEPREARGLVDADMPVGWSADGRAVFVARRGAIPIRIDRVDLATGRREFWKDLTPSDPAGLTTGAPYIRMATDGRSYAWTPVRLIDDLYLAEGLR